jgi:hypothetical protein
MAITWEDIKGALKRAIGRGRLAGEPGMVVTRTAGPASYVTGGFDVTVGELSEIQAAVVIAGGGYTADIDLANSDKNKLRVVVYQTDTTTGAPTQVGAGTDLSGVYFTIIAFGW